MNEKAFDYDKFGQKYSGNRQSDPGIAIYINRALGSAKTVINVGAGAGSYEPEHLYVVAVEPSVVMRSQRISKDKAPAINAKADNLPFDDQSFDAAMALLTVHHWPDLEKGLKELRRVTKDRVVIMTFDPDELDNFWNANYFPELIAIEKKRYPSIELIINLIGGKCEVISIPIPLDCADGFQEAFYGRPEAFLKREVRQSQSAWGFLAEGIEEKLVKALEDDLKSGEWDKKYGHFRKQPTFTCALRLIVSAR